MAMGIASRRFASCQHALSREVSCCECCQFCSGKRTVDRVNLPAINFCEFCESAIVFAAEVAGCLKNFRISPVSKPDIDEYPPADKGVLGMFACGDHYTGDIGALDARKTHRLATPGAILVIGPCLAISAGRSGVAL